MDGAYGYCNLDDDHERATIWLVNTMDRGQLVETFCEEWAHLRCANLVDTEDHADDTDHHPSFWAEYGRITLASRGIAW
jgi:hypothetical protein